GGLVADVVEESAGEPGLSNARRPYDRVDLATPLLRRAGQHRAERGELAAAADEGSCELCGAGDEAEEPPGPERLLAGDVEQTRSRHPGDEPMRLVPDQ